MLDQFDTNALNIFHKILMSSCAEVFKFGSSVSCKTNQVSSQNWLQMENVDIKFWTSCINRCSRFLGMPMVLFYLPLTGTVFFFFFWSCELRADVDCTIKLKWRFNYTHLSRTSCPGNRQPKFWMLFPPLVINIFLFPKYSYYQNAFFTWKQDNLKSYAEIEAHLFRVGGIVGRQIFSEFVIGNQYQRVNSPSELLGANRGRVEKNGSYSEGLQSLQNPAFTHFWRQSLEWSTRWIVRGEVSP